MGSSSSGSNLASEDKVRAPGGMKTPQQEHFGGFIVVESEHISLRSIRHFMRRPKAEVDMVILTCPHLGLSVVGSSSSLHI
jgi:hypothetical protein